MKKKLVLSQLIVLLVLISILACKSNKSIGTNSMINSSLSSSNSPYEHNK